MVQLLFRIIFYTIQIQIIFSACSTIITDYPCMTDGTQIMKQYDFAEEDLNLNISLMTVLYVVFNILAYFFLYKKINK